MPAPRATPSRRFPQDRGRPEGRPFFVGVCVSRSAGQPSPETIVRPSAAARRASFSTARSRLSSAAAPNCSERSMNFWSVASVQRRAGGRSVLGRLDRDRPALPAFADPVRVAGARRGDAARQDMLELGAHRCARDPAHRACRDRVGEPAVAGVGEQQPVEHDVGVEHDDRQGRDRRTGRRLIGQQRGRRRHETRRCNGGHERSWRGRRQRASVDDRHGGP